MMRLPQAGERGVALVTAILIAGLVSALAVGMMTSQQLDIRRTGNVLEADQAELLGRSVETWVSRMLLKDDPAIDHPGEEWAMGLDAVPVEQGQVAGSIEDLQGRFNINNLVLAEKEEQQFAEQQFRRMLASCDAEPETLQAVIDWLDTDAEPRFPGGAEDDYYLNLDQPYRTANRPMASPSELRLVRGVSDALYQCLAPHVSTLPAATKVNVNTATAKVYLSLADSISEQSAEALVNERPAGGYATVADFLALGMLAGTGLEAKFLDVKSNYFMVHSLAKSGRTRITVYSMIRRKEKRSTVLARSFNTY